MVCPRTIRFLSVRPRVTPLTVAPHLPLIAQVLATPHQGLIRGIRGEEAGTLQVVISQIRTSDLFRQAMEHADDCVFS